VFQVCSDDIWVKDKETDKKQLLIPGLIQLKTIYLKVKI
jgi:hypothetical protein